MSAWCSFKICRTSDADGRPLHEADVPTALMALQSVGSWDGVQIFPDAEPGPDGHWQFPCISTGWEREGRGYIVQCFETSDSLSFILSTSAALSKPEVYVELGGATQELWPRQLFAPYDLTLKAIQHFLATGLQDPVLFWVGLSDFPRKTVARRSRWERAMTRKRPTASEMLEKFDHSKHGGEFPGLEGRAPDPVNSAMRRTVFGLIERDGGGSYQGTILGFEHVIFTGPTAAVVEQRLRAHVAQMTANGTLVLETDFDSVVPIGAVEVADLRSVLGEELLGKLAGGDHDRLALLEEVVHCLLGTYDEGGVRRWFTRPRPQLDGLSPAEALTVPWSRESPRALKVLALARSLTTS